MGVCGGGEDCLTGGLLWSLNLAGRGRARDDSAKRLHKTGAKDRRRFFKHVTNALSNTASKPRVQTSPVKLRRYLNKDILKKPPVANQGSNWLLKRTPEPGLERLNFAALPLLRTRGAKRLKKLHVFEALMAWNTRLPKRALSVSQSFQDDECWNYQTFKAVRKPGRPAPRHDFKNAEKDGLALFPLFGRMCRS